MAGVTISHYLVSHENTAQIDRYTKTSGISSNGALVQVTQTYCNYDLKDSQGTETKQRPKRSREKYFITSALHSRQRQDTFHSWPRVLVDDRKKCCSISQTNGSRRADRVAE